MFAVSLSSSGASAILGEPFPPTIQGLRHVKMSGTDAYEFIRICLSHRTDAARRKALQPFVEAGIDWQLVQREARRHRVLPLLFSVLEDLMREQLPSPVREQSREHRHGIQIQNTFVIEELKRIVQQFEDEDLPILALKGPLLAQTAYGDISLRQSVDLDVLIPEERFSEADRLLREIGYEYANKRKVMTGWRKKLSLYLDGQWEFTRGNSFALDVHTRLMPPGYSLPVDFRPYWERSRPVQLGESSTVRGLSPEDQVLILAHHGIKNQWRALKYVADIAEVVRTESPLDWETLMERARQVQANRILRLGLSLADDILAADLPPKVQKWARGNPIDDVSLMLQEYLQEPSQGISLPYIERVQLQLATKDTVLGRIRYGLYSATQHIWSTVLKP